MDTNKSERELMQQQIQELSSKVEELEEQIQSISVPVIPSIMPNTVLIPIVGDLYPERFNMIIPRILSHVAENESEWVILDFTAISLRETISLNTMAQYIENVTSALQLMGAKVLAVGLGPQLTQELVSASLPFTKELDCFLDFKNALQFVMKQMRLQIIRS